MKKNKVPEAVPLSKAPVLDIEWQVIALNTIKLHSSFSQVRSFYTNDPYFLSSPELISRKAILEFLEQHPITVIKKNTIYYCISGFRSFFIANTALNTTPRRCFKWVVQLQGGALQAL
jgi:hypothetical protein